MRVEDIMAELSYKGGHEGRRTRGQNCPKLFFNHFSYLNF